jgi:hypothetical protein
MIKIFKIILMLATHRRNLAYSKWNSLPYIKERCCIYRLKRWLSGAIVSMFAFGVLILPVGAQDFGMTLPEPTGSPVGYRFYALADDTRVADDVQVADDIRFVDDIADDVRVADDVADDVRVADDVADDVRVTDDVADDVRVADDVADDTNSPSCKLGENSFTPDTLVTTPDGDKPIGDIEVGDIVLAYNEETGEIGEYPVTAVWVHDDDNLLTLTIEGEVIITTTDHPFYTDEGEWILAGDLQIGDAVVSADGDFGTVDAVVITDGTAEVYNLTVDEAHTYFVGDGEWLVHNSCDNPNVRDARLNDAKSPNARIIQLDPEQIRWSQERINWQFKDGRSIFDTRDMLVEGTLTPSDLPTPRIVQYNGEYFALDHRRLWAIRDAGNFRPEGRFDSVDFILEDINHPTIYNEFLIGVPNKGWSPRLNIREDYTQITVKGIENDPRRQR